MIVSIIIVNYNTHEYLDKCLNSIQKNLKDLDYEIIVVDNDSPDREIEKVELNFPRVNFYFLKKNQGFGAGCNYGVKKSSGKYLLFVNPDIEFTDNSVFKLINFMEENANAGASSGLLHDENDKPAYNYNNSRILSRCLSS